MSSEEESSSSAGDMGVAGRLLVAGDVSVTKYGNTVTVQIFRRGKNVVRLFGLNGNRVYEKSFEGDRVQVTLPDKSGRQPFVLTVEQDGKRLVSRQVR